MDFIKAKKIKPGIVIALLYVSFCAASWYEMRGALASMAQYGNLFSSAVINNDVVAFLVGGLVPLGIYELLTRFVFRFSQVRIGGATDDMRYALRFFYIGANLAAFGLKLLYLAFPLLYGYGTIFIDFITAAAFVVGYFFYIARHGYFEKERLSMVLYQLGGAFIIIYAFMGVLGILTEVFL